MFRKNKKAYKAKLEHQLYLARENPEPTFDLSDCDLRTVPSGIYSLCRVFLKESLHLEHNLLSSLYGGGQLKDLSQLQIMDLHDNKFTVIPEEIELLTNLLELYLNDNQIKKLPPSICNLHKLQILDVSNNSLTNLPENIGNLSNLRKLNILTNKRLKALPKSLCYSQRLFEIQVEPGGFSYPADDIIEKGTEAIMRHICDDNGYDYVSPDTLEDIPAPVQDRDVPDHEDSGYKEQKMQDFLEIERNNELLQRQEFEMASAAKGNREKLLTDIVEQQNRLDFELSKIQQVKDSERFRLIEQLQEVEQNADLAINQLLALNKEPLIQLLEHEKREEERLLNTARKYSETLRKRDVLEAMQELLEQETEKFKQYDESRAENNRSILEQEMQTDTHLLDVLHNQGLQHAELVLKLQEDVELQKAAVGALLERGDARSWGLVQQVRLVESQLAALTTIELDRRKLRMDEHVNDLAEKRTNLSILLMELLEQQGERRAQLLSTLKMMEAKTGTEEDFWLRRYQQLLDRMPSALAEAQQNMDITLSQALLMSGVLHCLPFLAYLTKKEGELSYVTEEDLRNVGVTNSDDQMRIMDAFRIYTKAQYMETKEEEASAPVKEVEQPSAPPLDTTPSISASECVICMDNECGMVFLPCGHLCCCVNCSNSVEDCPMCRATIERKIRIYNN